MRRKSTFIFLGIIGVVFLSFTTYYFCHSYNLIVKFLEDFIINNSSLLNHLQEEISDVSLILSDCETYIENTKKLDQNQVLRRFEGLVERLDKCKQLINIEKTQTEIPKINSNNVILTGLVSGILIGIIAAYPTILS